MARTPRVILNVFADYRKAEEYAGYQKKRLISRRQTYHYNMASRTFTTNNGDKEIVAVIADSRDIWKYMGIHPTQIIWNREADQEFATKVESLLKC